MVVVENVDRQRSVRFAEALAAELRHHPDRFTNLFYRLNPENFKPWALLYPEVADLRNLQDNLKGQKNLLCQAGRRPPAGHLLWPDQRTDRPGHDRPGLHRVSEESAPEELPDVSLLNASLKQLLFSLKEDRPYASPFQTFFPRHWRSE